MTYPLAFPRAGQAPPRGVRRRGVALIYSAMGLSLFVGMAALVVDMGQLYTKRAQAQRAADAAALAGALDLSKGAGAARAKAIEYARLNGYDDARGDVLSVEALPKGSAYPNRLQVVVQKREPLFFVPAFAALIGKAASSSLVGAGATAEANFKTDPILPPIDFGAEYGSAGGFANPTLFGPQGKYEHGDAYSPHLRPGAPAPPPTTSPTQPGTEIQAEGAPKADAAPVAGTTLVPNEGTEDEPRGIDFPGYEYILRILPDYEQKNGTSEVQLEIFDPDGHVADLGNHLGSWDEYHMSADNSNFEPTTTEYTLLAPKRSESDPDRVIATATYGDDAGSNLKWVTPGGFKFNMAEHGGAGDYRVRVKALEGTSENGFQFRAGKPHAGLDTQAGFEEWKRDYNAGGAGNGTQFAADGKMVLNFTRTGRVEINMGFVPAGAEKVFIDKFDTDVGFQSMSYSIRPAGPDGKPSSQPLDASLPPGTKAENGQWAPTDTLDVPPNYPSQGAYWFVTYDAGAFDTSNWKMSYSGTGKPGAPGSVRLVD